MSTAQEVTKSQIAVAPDQQCQQTFDPAAYFDQWLADLNASREQLAAKTQKAVTEKGATSRSESMPDAICEVTFEGSLHFEGHATEDIRSPAGSLVVTNRGIVEANIEVAIAVIEGVVNGNIRASKRVILECNAKVTGQIATPSLSVSPCAIFNGDWVLTTTEELPLEEASPAEPGEELKVFSIGA